MESVWSFFLRHCVYLGFQPYLLMLYTGGSHLYCSYLFFWLRSVTCFSGWSCLALLYASRGIALELLYSGRVVAIGPNVVWSTPFPGQESTLEVMLSEFAWTLEWVVLGRHMMLQISVFYIVFPQKMVYRQNMICRQTHRPTHASQMPVRPVFTNKPKFWYFHGSWFLVVQVPCLSRAGQSGLPWGVLPAVLDVTFPDGLAPAGTSSTDGAGVREMWFPTPAMGSSHLPCPMLELMGSK